MKLKITAKHCEIAARLSLTGDNYSVYENGKLLPSQWISEGKTGVMLLRFENIGEHIVEIKESEGKTLRPIEHGFKNAFPEYKNVTFEDRVVGISFPEREGEEQVGKTFYLKNCPTPEITATEGELAKTVCVKAYYCDETGNRAPFEPYAKYSWIFIGGVALVSARIFNAEKYAVSVLVPALKDKTLYKGGYPELSGNAENAGYGFDGYAMHLNDTECVGVFSASCLVLPDCLVGASVGKDCCKHGEEICTAALYVGTPENGEKYAKNGVPLLEYDIEYVFCDFDYEYNFSAFSIFFKKTEGGVKWGYKGKTFSTAGYVDPFRIVTVNGGTVASKNWDNVRFMGDCVQLTSENGNEATIYIKEENGELVTSLSVIVPRIESIYFPQLCVTANGKVDLFVPSCAGQIENNVLSRDVRYRESYSGPFANMSFLGPIDQNGNGFYVCWEGSGERRDYVVETYAWRKSIEITSLLYPENMCEIGHFLTKNVVVSQTENGWLGMCNRYREYAKNTVWWNKSVPISQSIYENRLWLWSHFRWEDERGVQYKGDESAREWYSVIEKLKSHFNAKFGIMAYDWIANTPLAYRRDLWQTKTGDENISGKTGDGITVKQAHYETGTNYMPHYDKVRQGIIEAIEKVRSEGMCVLPYVDNRLWDPRDYILGDYKENWLNTGKEISVKDKDGSPLMEYYCHHLPDGTPANSAVICTHTEKWQQINIDFVNRIMDVLKVDGVYLDQISAMPPALCMDKSHGHPLGGGTWWREGYEKWLRA